MIYKLISNKRKKFIYNILLVLSVCFISSCAVISSPTGGERDKTPPKILAELPSNKTTNFNAKTINITFDEFIQLQNPQNIIITPDIEPKPIFTAKRKELSIKFKNELDTNTTYTIFFGNELKDNNEGNPTDNYTYVFSTGSFLDSISLTGNVQSVDAKIPNNTFVVLYKDLNDSAFISNRPFYITRVQSNGTFEFKNLKQGNYNIYALSDNNNNYYFDLPTEQIGFLTQRLQIDSNLQNLTLPLFLSEASQLRISEKDKAVQNGIFNLSFNKLLSPIDDHFEVLTETDSLKALAFVEDKNVKIYFTNLSADTGRIKFALKHNQSILDTIDTKISKSKTRELFFDTLKTKNLRFCEACPLEISANRIVVSNIDSNQLSILDTAQNSIPFVAEQNEDLKSFSIKSNLSAQKYKLMFHDATIQDLAGNFNAKQEISILVDEAKKFCNLLINIELDTILPTLIFNLKDNLDNILKKEFLRHSQAFKINIGLMPAGTYKVEIIKDDNNNEIWNSGNFTNKTLPEKIYKHSTPIIVKENWDSEETIRPNFSESNQSTMNSFDTIMPSSLPSILNQKQKDRIQEKNLFKK